MVAATCCLLITGTALSDDARFQCIQSYEDAMALIGDIHNKVNNLDYDTGNIDSSYARDAFKNLNEASVKINSCVISLKGNKRKEIDFFLIIIDSTLLKKLKMFSEKKDLSRIEIINGISTLRGNTLILLKNANKVKKTNYLKSKNRSKIGVGLRFSKMVEQLSK